MEPGGRTAPPSRPREIRLDTVDPCVLVPQADYPDYFMEDEPGEPDTDDEGAAECVWAGTFIGTFAITLRTYEGIGPWLDGSRSGIAERVDPIQGFPAITIQLKGDANFCMVGVDVAEGQTMLVQLDLNEGRPGNLPPICEYAHQFATSVMSTLVNQ